MNDRLRKRFFWGGSLPFGFVLIGSFVMTATSHAQSKLQIGGFVERFSENNDLSPALNQTGLPFSETTDPGYGGRVRMMALLGDQFELGGSAGYLKGPREKWRTFFIVINQQIETETEFSRFLVEGAFKIPIHQKWGFRLGAGAGVANGRIEVQSTLQTIFPPANTTEIIRESWSGFTWEISPAFVFDLGRTSLELGFRYADFPELDKEVNGDRLQFKWSATVAYLGFNVGF